MSENKVNLTVVTDASVQIRENGDDATPITDLLDLPAGVDFRITTTTPTKGYLYALLVSRSDKKVTVAYPRPESSRAVAANVFVAIPDANGWAQSFGGGTLRLVIADQIVPSSNWAGLLPPDRDGNTHTPTNSEGSPPPSTTGDGNTSTGSTTGDRNTSTGNLSGQQGGRNRPRDAR